MRKPDPKTLAVDLLNRSDCHVQVAATIFDDHGIFSWGWNSSGPTGFGQHAEAHALSRANRKRLRGASIAVAGRRKYTVVPSKPCGMCYVRLLNAGIARVYIQNKQGDWHVV